MQNTWSIGRTWKPREGWSRPVLTDERQHQHSNPWRLDRIFLLQTTPDGNEHCLATRRNIDISASAVRFPGRHRPAGHCSRPYKRRFAAAMAQVRRPVPFRTRKLRPGTAMVLHPTGCGRVARRRIQLDNMRTPVEPDGSRGLLISAILCRIIANLKPVLLRNHMRGIAVSITKFSSPPVPTHAN